MQNFQKIAHNIDVLPLVLDLYRQPELWNVDKARTTDPGGPHEGLDDIWVRFRDPVELTSPGAYAEPFIPVMYPAWYSLPHLRPIVFSLMARLEAVQLGLILITRVGADKQVAPHDDRGRWGAEYFATKVYIPLATNPYCYNHCANEQIVMGVGEAWLFDNLKVHSTVNQGATDRMTLIVSMRCE